MTQTQTCYVCGGQGLLADSPIYVGPDDGGGISMIGQCPRCNRFICSRHGEKLDLTRERKSTWFPVRRHKAGVLVLCCPFDPGVALNDEDLS